MTCGLFGWCMSGHHAMCRVFYLAWGETKRCACDCHRDAA